MSFKINKSSYDKATLKSSFEALLDDRTSIKDRERYIKYFKAWCVKTETDILAYKNWERQNSKAERQQRYDDTKYSSIL